MVSNKETDNFLSDEKQKSSSQFNTCHEKWWNQNYHYQEAICRVIESFYFQALIIFLVIVDTALVITEIILDSFKIHYECEEKLQHSSKKHHDEVKLEHFEMAMEMVHFASIVILSFFFIELLVRIYGLGKEFWNIRRKKMEYFDAFIVITSLAIDLAFLTGEKKIVGEKLILILTFRLWRFIRIISSVSEAIRHGQTKHKRNLNSQYLIAVKRLVELLKHKTSYTESNKDDLDLVLEHFHMIDDQCQSALDALNKDHELTSSLIVAQFNDDLYKLEYKPHHSIIASMFAKPAEV